MAGPHRNQQQQQPQQQTAAAECGRWEAEAGRWRAEYQRQEAEHQRQVGAAEARARKTIEKADGLHRQRAAQVREAEARPASHGCHHATPRHAAHSLSLSRRNWPVEPSLRTEAAACRAALFC
eukprot:SAG22_NODE_3328_length_1776_cov_1.011330_3_plen_123_part_00